MRVRPSLPPDKVRVLVFREMVDLPEVGEMVRYLRWRMLPRRIWADMAVSVKPWLVET